MVQIIVVDYVSQLPFESGGARRAVAIPRPNDAIFVAGQMRRVVSVVWKPAEAGGPEYNDLLAPDPEAQALVPHVYVSVPL